VSKPRILAIEIVVEMEGGNRTILRVERPTIRVFDGDLNRDLSDPNAPVASRVRLDVEGSCSRIAPHYTFTRGGPSRRT
jgi:hypothetical protein